MELSGVSMWNDDEPDGSGPDSEEHPTRGLAFVGVMGLLVAAAAVVAGVTGAWLQSIILADEFPFSFLVAAVTLLCTPLALRTARWANLERPAVAAPLALAGSAAMLFLFALRLERDEVVSSFGTCGTEDYFAVVLSPIGFFIAGSLAALLALAPSGMTLHRRDRLLRLASLGALALGASLVAGSLIRLIHNPTPTGYVDSLPVHATLPAISGEPSRRDPQSQDVYEDDVDGLVARRVCSASSCSLSLLAAADRDVGKDGADGEGRGPPSSLSVSPHTATRLRRDAKHGFWVLAPVGEQYPSGALRDPKPDADPEHKRQYTATAIQVRDVADALAAPLNWIAGGAAGLALAVLFFFKRLGAAARLGHPGEADEPTPGSSDRLAALDALILAIVLLSLAPLLAAWLQDLV